VILRYVIFVDGSNLIGSLKRIDVRIANYEQFFKMVFRKAVDIQETLLINGQNVAHQLTRIYWYALGSIDGMDVNDTDFERRQRDVFNRNDDMKRKYLALSRLEHPQASESELGDYAWKSCFAESKSWYEDRVRLIDSMRSFFRGLRNKIDCLDVIECGHWKVDFLGRTLTEKGIDTSLAIDMVTLLNNFDVGLIISGDADAIPSINYAKRAGKQIGAVEIIKGSLQEKLERQGRQFSSRLRVVSDFVIQLFETDLQSD